MLFAAIGFASAFLGGRDDIPVTAANRWIYEGVNYIYRSGIIHPDVNGRDFYPRKRPASRWSVAFYYGVAALTLTNYLDWIPKSLADAHPSDELTPWLLSQKGKLIGFAKGEGFAKTIDAMIRVQKEFNPELRSIGADNHFLENKARYLKRVLPTFEWPEVGRTHTGFRDVGLDHWAGKSVEELKAKGILSGYSDGKFRG